MIIRWTPDEFDEYRRRSGLNGLVEAADRSQAAPLARKDNSQQAAAAKLSAKRERSSAAPDLEAALGVTLMQAKLGGFETNYRFDVPRRWELDFAWIRPRVAIEVQGGVQSYGRVGHTRPESYQRDAEKMRRAQLMGWIVLPCTPADLRDGSIIADLETALELRR